MPIVLDHMRYARERTTNRQLHLGVRPSPRPASVADVTAVTRLMRRHAVTAVLAALAAVGALALARAELLAGEVAADAPGAGGHAQFVVGVVVVLELGEVRRVFRGARLGVYLGR